MKKTYIVFIFVIIMFLVVSVFSNTNINLSKLSGDVSLATNGSVDRIHFVNVGGDTILIESQGKFGLIDAGSENKKAWKYLEKVMGDSYKLSFIILTHTHGDHAGGMDDIINKFTNSSTTFYIGEGREASNTNTINNIKELCIARKIKIIEYASKLSSGKYTSIVNKYTYDSSGNVTKTETTISGNNNITLNNFNIKIFNYQHDKAVIAGKDTKDDENRNSLIQLVTHTSGKKALLTADMEFDDEDRFLCTSEASNAGECRSSAQKEAIQNVDILKMGHHGKYTSSGIDFINWVNPSDVFVTSGLNEDYNESMFNYAALKHLDDKGKKIYFVAAGDLDGHDFDSSAYPGRQATLVTFGSSKYTITKATGDEFSNTVIKTGKTDAGDTSTSKDMWYQVNYPYGNQKAWLYYENKSVDDPYDTSFGTFVYEGKSNCFGFNVKSALRYDGWIIKNNKIFYFSPVKVYGSNKTIDGKTYTFDSGSACSYNFGYLKSMSGTTGWVDTGGKVYYLNSSYEINDKGLQKINNSYYYFRTDKSLYTGFQNIDGKRHYFSETGSYGALGKMVVSSCKTINGLYYCFDGNGAVNNTVAKPTAATYCKSTTYNGSSQTITKAAATGYTFSNNTGTNAGSYTVTAKLNKYLWTNYTNTDVTFTCKIAAKDVGGVTITVSNQVYTGSALTPNPVVKDGTKTLVKDTDYTVTYSNNKNVGTATVTITGKGNYKGSKTGTFKINEDPTHLLDKPTAATYCKSTTYNGSSQTITKAAGTGYTFSNNTGTNAGTYTVIATLTSGYKWKDGTTANVSFNCTIEQKSISGATVTINNQIYTGSPLTPDPVVKDGTKTLTKNTDYTVSYSNNTDVGIATVTITGKGNYKNSISDVFEIVSDAGVVTKPTTDNCKNNIYNGKSQILTKNPGDGYTYSNNTGTDVGTYIVTATLNEGYRWKDDTTSPVTITCPINRLDINNVSMTINDQEYTGSALTPLPIITEDDLTLEVNKDYDITYSNNTNIGEATVTLTGKGNYEGTRIIKFNIATEVAAITIKDTSYMSIDNSYIKVELQVNVKNISKGQFMSNLSTKGRWEVKDKSDNIIDNNDTLLTTSASIVSDNRTYKIIILGDIYKDGVVNIKDMYQSYLLYKNRTTELDDDQRAAGDYDKNGVINIQDLYRVYRKMKE